VVTICDQLKTQKDFCKNIAISVQNIGNEQNPAKIFRQKASRGPFSKRFLHNFFKTIPFIRFSPNSYNNLSYAF